MASRSTMHIYRLIQTLNILRRELLIDSRGYSQVKLEGDEWEQLSRQRIHHKAISLYNDLPYEGRWLLQEMIGEQEISQVTKGMVTQALLSIRRNLDRQRDLQIGLIELRDFVLKRYGEEMAMVMTQELEPVQIAWLKKTIHSRRVPQNEKPVTLLEVATLLEVILTPNCTIDTASMSGESIVDAVCKIMGEGKLLQVALSQGLIHLIPEVLQHWVEKAIDDRLDGDQDRDITFQDLVDLLQAMLKPGYVLNLNGFSSSDIATQICRYYDADEILNLATDSELITIALPFATTGFRKKKKE